MDYKEGDKVALIIGHQTTLGYTVLIDEEFEGLLFKSDLYKDIEEGMRVEGYIKKLREDGKIDVSLRQQGFKSVIDTDVQTILDQLKKNEGILKLTDKSSPEAIKFRLQMSKKAFKRAIGNLYKNKKITIGTDKITLLEN